MNNKIGTYCIDCSIGLPLESATEKAFRLQSMPSSQVDPTLFTVKYRHNTKTYQNNKYSVHNQFKILTGKFVVVRKFLETDRD